MLDLLVQAFAVIIHIGRAVWLFGAAVLFLAVMLLPVEREAVIPYAPPRWVCDFGITLLIIAWPLAFSLLAAERSHRRRALR